MRLRSSEHADELVTTTDAPPAAQHIGATELLLADGAEPAIADLRQKLSMLTPGDDRIDPLIVAAFDPDDPLTGAVRGLRSTVLATEGVSGGPIRSLLLVGAGAETETTIAAANLAVACAQAGRRTLVVEVDGF